MNPTRFQSNGTPNHSNAISDVLWKVSVLWDSSFPGYRFLGSCYHMALLSPSASITHSDTCHLSAIALLTWSMFPANNTNPPITYQVPVWPPSGSDLVQRYEERLYSLSCWLSAAPRTLSPLLRILLTRKSHPTSLQRKHEANDNRINVWVVQIIIQIKRHVWVLRESLHLISIHKQQVHYTVQRDRWYDVHVCGYWRKATMALAAVDLHNIYHKHPEFHFKVVV